MTDHPHHTPHTIERRCDVAVIGGSAAGLAAALQLARQRRSVIVVDSGEPRNGPAAHMHSYLGHEGRPPADFAAIARAEVRSYGAEVLPGRAVAVSGIGDSGSDDRFVVELTGGHRLVARRVLVASGIVDELPEIDGLAEHWGVDVIHCPFCHGFEVRDRRIVQIVTHPMGLHPVGLFRQLTDDLTIVLHDGVHADHPELAALRSAGVDVVDERVARVVTGDDGHVTAVELVGGRQLGADAVVVGARFRPRVEFLDGIGVEVVDHPTGFGTTLATDETGMTAVAGLYAAGNVTDPSQQVIEAAARGGRVAAMISFDLARADIAAATKCSANEADWDGRYSGDQIWSGNPNGGLVAQVEAMSPGRALDVGAGEGGDAVWLAEQGWQVTASDVSQRALDRVAGAAAERGLEIECLHADANALAPFEHGAFDLVCAQYASIPRTPDARGIENLLGAVAPCGTLVVVSHDITPMRTPINTRENSRPWDPDAFVRTDDISDILDASSDWTIEHHARHERSAGAASHHVHDIVLRARRHQEQATH